MRKTAESREAPSGQKRVAEADSSASVEHRNIPAILPYEVKEALLRDMREEDTKPLKEEPERSQARVGLN